MIATCPTADSLQRYSLGHLDEEQSDLIFSHLAECSQCQDTIGEQHSIEDSLLEELRSNSDANHQDYESETECQQAMAKALAAIKEQGGRNDLSLPKKVGDYEILRQIGHGGMGTVYLAQHQKLGRQVALKSDCRKSFWLRRRCANGLTRKCWPLASFIIRIL